LNKFTNIQTPGYVSTASAISDITSVEADIKYYAAWSKYNGAHIAICDEAPSYIKDDIFSYMSNVLSFVDRDPQSRKRSCIF
jgi:hypothetical protein